MSTVTRLASGYRARKAGLGMVLDTSSLGGKGRNPAATVSVSYATPHLPKMPDWDADWASRGLYLMSGYVMRCARIIADTIASLPFRAGPDPTMPVQSDPASGLAHLLGPATITAPGGPNATTSARTFWAWSIVQYVVSGRWAWEIIRDPSSKQIEGLWPLVSRSLFPVPSTPDVRRAGQSPGSAGLAWWESFQYQTPLGVIPLASDRVFYAWRPSILDWREPESDLQAARVAVQLVVGIERYMWALLSNQMVAQKLIVSPPIEEAAERRAWEESFLSEFTGFDNAGKTIFAYAESDFDPQGKLTDKAQVQVIDLATKSIDAQLREIALDAKTDITIAMGVPRSLIGDASQRTYANANSENRNFWTTKILNLLSEIQDPVNVSLAPQIGNDVGWFDLGQVEAVQPPSVFAPPSIKDAIDEGVVTPEDVAKILNITGIEATAADVATVPLGEEAVASGIVGGRSARDELLHPHEGWRMVHDGLRLAPNWFVRDRGRNSWTIRNGVWYVDRRREEALVSRYRSVEPPLAKKVTATVTRVQAERHVRHLTNRIEAVRQRRASITDTRTDTDDDLAEQLDDEQTASLERLGDALSAIGLDGDT